MDDEGRTPVLQYRQGGRRAISVERKRPNPTCRSPDRRSTASRWQELVFGAGHPRPARRTACARRRPRAAPAALRVGAEFLRSSFRPRERLDERADLGQPQGHVRRRRLSRRPIIPITIPPRAGWTFDRDVRRRWRRCRRATSSCCTSAATTRPAWTCRRRQWREVADIAAQRRWIPFFDFAYQGFGDGLDADRAGPAAVSGRRPAAFSSAASFSKNFGLYNERVGALPLVARTPAAARPG